MSDFVSAREVCQLLGVKLQTVYVYAAKGLLTAYRAPGERRSTYPRDQVLRLKLRAAARGGHTAVAAGALRWGEPVLDSAITRIDPRLGPVYRGRPALELAERASFESVCELLWGSGEPGAPVSGQALTPARLVQGDAFGRALGWLASQRARPRLGLAPEREVQRARELVRAFPGAFATDREAGRRARHAPDVASALVLALSGRRPSAAQHRAVTALLVLAADHELNASTFAARVAASAGADLAACLVAAMATFTGPLHGASSLRIGALLDEARAVGVAAAVDGRLARGEGFPGFEVGAYAGPDPRTAPLLAHATAVGARRPALVLMGQLARRIERATGRSPTVDWGFVAVALALGLPADAGATLFAAGRIAGWVAHVLEQRQRGAPIRPRARYVGPSRPLPDSGQ